MSSTAVNHYELLGVPPDASSNDIKRAYRALMRKYHPDVYGPEGTGISAGIGLAYSILSDDTKRAEYDDALAAPDQSDGAPGEPVADWGEEVEWTADEVADETVAGISDEDEIVDGEVADEPPVNVPAPPAEMDAKVTFISPARTAGRVAVAWVAVAAALWLFSWAPWASAAPLPLGDRHVWFVIAAAVGTALGVVLLAAGRRRTSQLRQGHSNVTAVLTAAAAALVAIRFLVPAEFGPFGMLGMVTVAGVAAGYAWSHFAHEQQRLDRFIPRRTLRQSNVFGVLPGGVAPELLNRELEGFCADPAVRLLRTPDGSLFSHAVVKGGKVAFARGIVTNGGNFRWSGPSLLNERPGGYPQEVIRNAQPHLVETLNGQIGKTATCSAWLFIFDEQGIAVEHAPQAGMPHVAAPRDGVQQMANFFTDEPAIVNQQIITNVAVAITT